MLFKNRNDAGQQLCKLLSAYKGKDVVVYAIPRGGVAVAKPIAMYLKAPLQLVFAHKIGHPQQPEYAIGAISESGLIVSSEELSHLGEKFLEDKKEKQIQEIKRRKEKYLKGIKEIPLKNKIAIIVDDGIATGLTMQVAIKELREKNPSKIIVVVPVSPRSTAEFFKKIADDFIALEICDDDKFLGAVGSYYDEFRQVEDDEVIRILNI